VSRRELVTRIATAVGAVICVVLAVGLALLAADVARERDALVAGDVRYRVAPEDPELWSAETRVPFPAAADVLGIEDDVAFRRALRALAAARLDDPVISDPELAISRNEAQARLEAVVTGDGDHVTRSRAAGLLGVLGLSRFVSETEGRGPLLSSTIASLQLAIDLDPENGEAKYNLESALQRGRGLELTEGSAGSDPAPGGSGAKGAGASDPGSGY
jgi:hypothetical protein